MSAAPEHRDIKPPLAELIRAVRSGDDGTAMRAVDTIVDRLGVPAALTRASEQLASSDGSMLQALVGETRDTPAIAVELVGRDGATCEIDDIDPATRAATRCVLAAANNDARGILDQLSVVEINAGIAGIVDAFVNILTWTVDLTAACERANVPVPAWIAEV